MPVIAALKRYFEKSENPVLFAGAGVSARAEVLTWAPLLDRLKEWIRARDPQTANLMSEYIHEQDLITAADYFFLSKRVPDGERLSAIVDHLSTGKSKVLSSLVGLPFRGFVTTNYDRCLLDAYAGVHGKATLDFRRGDNSFSQVLWCNDTFVARIHGAIELPTSIVLTSTHFSDLSQDQHYHDVLVNLFTRKNVLFLGCSFSDPAVRAVFEHINKQYGPTPPGLHTAFIPNDADHEFITRLGRMNVDTIRYDPRDRHRVVWEAIESFSIKCQTPIVAAVTQESSIAPFSSAKRYLASCYARVRLSGSVHPLREAVVEGVVSSVVQSHVPKAVSEQDVVATVHRELGINMNAAKDLVADAVDRLCDEKLCARHKEGRGRHKLAWKGKPEDANNLDVALGVLVQSAVDRAFVQEGLRKTQELIKSLQAFFKGMVLQRGWDLGAAFATNRSPEDVDISRLLHTSCPFLSLSEIDALKRVCNRMLTTPTEPEAKVLAELGRASFALEMAIQCPRSTLFHSTVLPEKVYLDANVLMPALTYGHQFHNVYKNTIERLRQATIQSGSQLRVIAYHGFLNEVVSHRRIAISEMEKWGDDFQEGVLKEGLYYGTANMNVFVGAYANVVQTEKDMSFPEFLSRYAPYTTEQELAQWIRKRGIVVQNTNEIRGSEFPNISLELQKAYSTDLASGKLAQLIEHDAVQLSALYTDQNSGRRSILVTADKRLREMVGKGKYKALTDHMISNVGLTQMIDLLVGNPGESRALASMIWSARASTRTEEVRQYLVTLALREYDEAMAMEMPKVAEKIAEEVVDEVERLGLRIDTDNAADRRKFLQVIGTFEERFFEGMRQAIEARESRQP